MPLIHVSDIEPMCDHLRANIIRYMLENHNVSFLDDSDEKKIYDFMLLTVQNYMLHPPPQALKIKMDWYDPKTAFVAFMMFALVFAIAAYALAFFNLF